MHLKHTMRSVKRPYLDRLSKTSEAATSTTATWPFFCSSYSFSQFLWLLLSVSNLTNLRSPLGFPKTGLHPLFLACLMKAEDSPFVLITEKTKIQIISSLKSLHFYFNKLLTSTFIFEYQREFYVKIKRQTFFF